MPNQHPQPVAWNPLAGCRQTSPGCERCYAELWAWRFAGEGLPLEGLVRETDLGPRFTGRAVLRPEVLAWPLGRPPQVAAVCTLGDPFLEAMQEGWVLALWGVMAALPRWQFHVSTKRPARARELLSRATRAACLASAAEHLPGPRERAALQVAEHLAENRAWPPANVWLGVSVEDQARADKRVPELVATPAALRFVAAEPLLGPVSLSRWLAPAHELPARMGAPHGIRWVTVAGESGPAARPMHPGHARHLRDECLQVGTAFTFKAWGQWSPAAFEVPGHQVVDCRFHGPALVQPHRAELVGRMLDGHLWDERPSL